MNSKSLCFLSFCFLLLGCATLSELATMKKPTLSIEDVSITDLSLKDAELTFDVAVENPNSLSAKLSAYNYDFKINESSFVSGSQPSNTVIEASGKSTLQIPIRIGFKELYNTFTSLKDQDEAAYTLNLIVITDLPVLGITEIPFETEGIFPVVKAPKLSVSGLKMDKLSLTKADFTLDLNIQNPNSFDVNLDRLKYEININGLNTINGIITESVAINKKGEDSIKLPVSINLLQLGASAYNMLKNKKPLDYSLSGSSIIGATLPLFRTSDFDFSHSGSININN